MHTVAIRFDGYIHAYSKGWKNGRIYDKPVEGIYEFISQALRHGCVFTYTNRPLMEVQAWILSHMPESPIFAVEIIPDYQIFWNRRDTLGITNRYIPSAVTIDDNALPIPRRTKLGPWHESMFYPLSWRESNVHRIIPNFQQKIQREVERSLRRSSPLRANAIPVVESLRALDTRRQERSHDPVPGPLPQEVISEEDARRESQRVSYQNSRPQAVPQAVTQVTRSGRIYSNQPNL